MIRHPAAGDIFWVNPNPVEGHEMRDRHPFMVITSAEINTLGTCFVLPITSKGAFAQMHGLTVPVEGRQIRGFAVCNQIRALDLKARQKAGTAVYIESVDASVTLEAVSRVISLLDPA